jgi:geranylgeranyl pyrophosphate synthase
VEDVLTVLEEIHAAEYAQDAMNTKADLALEQVKQVPIEPWARNELEELIEFLAARRY